MNSRSHPSALVVVAANSPEAYESSGAVVAHLLGIPLDYDDAPVVDAISIGPPAFAKKHGDAAELAAGASAVGRWDPLFESDEGGWIVTGSTPFAAAHTALTLAGWLRWSEPLPRPFRKVRRPLFPSMTVEFDDWSVDFARLADGFDMTKHVVDAARVGIQGLEINLLADAVPVQVRLTPLIGVEELHTKALGRLSDLGHT